MLKDKLININDNQTATFVMDLKLSDNITKTKDGYLLCENSIFGRTGFQTYKGKELVGMGFGDEELVQVFRDEQDVFDENSLKTFNGKPVTLGHPDVDVTIDNIDKLGKGYILGIPKKIGDNVVGDFMIKDKDTIKLVEEKKIRDLSLGYQTKLIRDEDKVRQTEIYINHLAIVENGRAGNARIMDELEDNMDKKELLETLSKSNGNTINIYFKDEQDVVEEVKEEVETKDEVEKNINDEKEVETKKDEEEVIEDEEKEEDLEDEEEKEKEKEETMTKDSIKEVLKGMTPEELKELGITLKDENTTNVNDEMFGKVKQVENTNIEVNAKINDYSDVTGNELVNALQKEFDSKFSFRELNKGTNSLQDRQNKLNDYKTRSGKDFIKGGL